MTSTRAAALLLGLGLLLPGVAGCTDEPAGSARCNSSRVRGRLSG